MARQGIRPQRLVARAAAREHDLDLPGRGRAVVPPGLRAGAALGFRQRLAARIVDEYDGAVPGTLAQLVTLPGVGRKTASVVLNALFILGGWRILRRTEDEAQADGYKVEKGYFRLSLYYTFLHFLALLVQHWLGGW